MNTVVRLTGIMVSVLTIFFVRSEEEMSKNIQSTQQTLLNINKSIIEYNQQLKNYQEQADKLITSAGTKTLDDIIQVFKTLDKKLGTTNTFDDIKQNLKNQNKKIRELAERKSELIEKHNQYKSRLDRFPTTLENRLRSNIVLSIKMLTHLSMRTFSIPIKLKQLQAQYKKDFDSMKQTARTMLETINKNAQVQTILTNGKIDEQKLKNTPKEKLELIYQNIKNILQIP